MSASAGHNGRRDEARLVDHCRSLRAGACWASRADPGGGACIVSAYIEQLTQAVQNFLEAEK
jgi:hypothetical protein